MFHIALAEFKHETNTLSAQKADLDRFQERSFWTGPAVRQQRFQTGTEMGAFFDVLEPETDVVLQPLLAANAMPSGPVTDQVFDLVLKQILTGLEHMPRVDAVLLSLHGAMVTESSGDGEGDLLGAIRKHLGPSVPIVATLDLHANVSPHMAREADVLIAYEAYPHVDMYERGHEAARLLLGMLRGTQTPQMACVHLPLIIPALTTLEAPMSRYLTLIQQMKKRPGVLSVSLAHGFLCADTPALGATAIAVAADRQAAEKLAAELARAVWADRQELRNPTATLDQALDLARQTQTGPVVFADVTDNPGGGGPGDGTHILRRLIDENCQGVAFALITDPQAVEAVHQAGVGALLDLKLGGLVQPDLLGAPIRCQARVRLLSDGTYQNRGPMSAGVTVRLGKSAVVEIGGIQVILAARRTQPYDTALFYAHGIDPTRQKILVLKSTHHYKAAFGPIAKRLIAVEVPGLMPQDPMRIPYHKIRRPLYPLDPDLVWAPETGE